MNANSAGVYGPETVELLRSVLEDAWTSLRPEQQREVSKTLLAERLMRAAARGERDPARLRVRTLFVVAP